MSDQNYLASLKNKEFLILQKLCDNSISQTEKEKFEKKKSLLVRNGLNVVKGLKDTNTIGMKIGDSLGIRMPIINSSEIF